jgi:hypothetical protein
MGRALEALQWLHKVCRKPAVLSALTIADVETAQQMLEVAYDMLEKHLTMPI